MSDVITILCSDIHLSHKPPTARAAEDNWFEAMGRPLIQLRDLSAKFNVPIICAGDIFHKWNSPPELINFALDALPEMISIFGQHDLPNHNYEEMERSAYRTLEKADKIEDLCGGILLNHCPDIALYGFSWGLELQSIKPIKDFLQIAVVHSYCWTTGCNYPNAPIEQQYSYYAKKLRGFDLAVFGDNHKQFSAALRGNINMNIYNCGCLIRRRFDEREYEPSVGLLYSDGHVERHKLDCSEDKWSDYTDAKANAEQMIDVSEFVTELNSLKNDSLDFVDEVKRFCERNKVSKEVMAEILQAVQGEE